MLQCVFLTRSESVLSPVSNLLFQRTTLYAGVGLAAYVQAAHANSSQAVSSTAKEDAASAEVAESVLQWCKARLSAAAVPISVSLLPHLPSSAGGKLMRGALPAPAWAVEGMDLPSELKTEGNSLLSKGSSHGADSSRVSKAVPAVLATHAMSAQAAAAHVDRFASKMVLQRPVPSQRVQGPGLSPIRDAISESKVLGLFREALGLPRLKPSDNFLQCGGDSLAAAAVANALSIHSDMVVAFPTARGLATAMRHGLTASLHELQAQAQPIDLEIDELTQDRANLGQVLPLLDWTQPAQLPKLHMPTEPAVATAADGEVWQHEAQQELLSHSQKGGWCFEKAGTLRWAGPASLTDLQQTLTELAQSQDSQLSPEYAADAASALQSQKGHSCAQAKIGQKQHQQQQQRQQLQSASAVPHHQDLNCAWRLKMKECVDAPPVVLIAGSARDSTADTVHPPQEPSRQQHIFRKTQLLLQQQEPQPQQQQQDYAQQQQQQQPVHTKEWVFACSHGGDVVCVHGQSGRAVWQTILPARAEAGLTITSDCKVLNLC